MTDSYEIEKPTSDINYFVIGVKHLVLFILLFFASWIGIPLLIAKRRGSRINPIMEFLLENIFVCSILFSLIIIVWFIYRIRKKYQYGEVFKLSFDDKLQKLSVWTINTMSNKEKERSYNYEVLTFNFSKNDDFLFGKQRILQILKNNNIVHKINFDRTAWCRNSALERLINRVNVEYEVL